MASDATRTASPSRSPRGAGCAGWIDLQTIHRRSEKHNGSNPALPKLTGTRCCVQAAQHACGAWIRRGQQEATRGLFSHSTNARRHDDVLAALRLRFVPPAGHQPEGNGRDLDFRAKSCSLSERLTFRNHHRRRSSMGTEAARHERSRQIVLFHGRPPITSAPTTTTTWVASRHQRYGTRRESWR
jgi:hypothetical protein